MPETLTWLTIAEVAKLEGISDAQVVCRLAEDNDLGPVFVSKLVAIRGTPDFRRVILLDSLSPEARQKFKQIMEA